jgi:cellulose synthase/poly-beta-1,6-N-acetylglucosamine synthase-like glycosyltransferase
MDNKTKILLGVGVLVVAAYYFLNKPKETKSIPSAKFVGADGVSTNTNSKVCGSVPCRSDEKEVKFDKSILCQQSGGNYVCRNKYNK